MAPADLRHLVGFGARVMIEQAFKQTGTPVEPRALDGLLELFLDHYRAHVADLSRPFPGVVETLGALQAEGARMGVLTNKPHEMSEMVVKALGLAPYFAAVFGQGKRPYLKPDRRIFADVAEAVGGAGLGAVMIGDSLTDVQTARAAGAPVILLPYGYTPVPARELGADAVVDKFADIPAALRPLLGGSDRLAREPRDQTSGPGGRS